MFSLWQEYRAEQTLAALRQLLPQQATVVREGRAVQLPIEQLVPGDIVWLEQGDHISADCRLIEAFGVRVDNAIITGESLPQVRQAGSCSDDELLYARNILLAGTSMVSGQARAVVFATGMHTSGSLLTDILAHNVPELVPYLAFSLLPIPLPLTPIQILAIDMGTDSLTALGLGVEAPAPAVMQRPPRSRSERLFNWPLAIRA